MDRWLKTWAEVASLFASWLLAFAAGTAICSLRPVARCPDYRVAPGSQQIIVPTLPTGDMDGAKCVTIRGYFDGEPSEWRYVGRPK